ncbi:hypothetical protein Bpla01_66600 [Burkholderia plantarii]|nr:hypothetical protein Bpla01_66600 [Burkholderia plantarii]
MLGCGSAIGSRLDAFLAHAGRGARARLWRGRSLYPCAPAGVRYASKRGGSQWQIHALNPVQKDGAQPHAFPGRTDHTARGASAPGPLARLCRALDLLFAREQRARNPG